MDGGEGCDGWWKDGWGRGKLRWEKKEMNWDGGGHIALCASTSECVQAHLNVCKHI